MPRLNLFEIFLLQLIFYTSLWLWDEYIASFACLVLPIVIAAILIISAIVELIEPARIGRKYFYAMAISVITPVIVGLIFYFVHDGRLAWFENPS